jgi:hypothetical protein
MTIEEIPADEVTVMTADLHRLFNAAGCDPWCHCCHKKLKVGMNFKLATVEVIPVTYTNYPNTQSVIVFDFTSIVSACELITVTL